jgi:hypothetical protein
MLVDFRPSVANGRVTDNWHVENNLTLLKQIDVAKIGP